MPSIRENLHTWNIGYDWKNRGDEWSESWGGPDMQWYGAILPRIHLFLPAKSILEIAPGFGRWTQFLKDRCESLSLLDLSEKCIDACKNRFRSYSHISYHVNDGKSLDMIQNESIDFVFSFDSLVHVEEDIIESYLNQLATKLTKNGVGIIHHSNLGEYEKNVALHEKAGAVRPFLIRCGIIEPMYHNRAITMTAEKFRNFAENVGLKCVSQEIINWGSKRLIDCITVFTKKGSVWSRPNIIKRNPDFMKEAKQILNQSALYGAISFGKE